MYSDITQYFNQLIEQSGGYDFAQAEFQRLMAEDAELKAAYREWCDENGYSERGGFRAFCDECMARENMAMDSLNDYDE